MKAGQVVAGKYRLDARLGIGGMGEVWKATHEGTEREFALKFMHPHVSTSSTARQRFTREAKVSAKINHPNVIDIFDVGEFDDGILFLAMELLDGVSLADALHATQPLSVSELLTIVLDTSRALAAAHAVGVVHRDLKPGNIYLHRDRATGLASAKILDFGISKLGGESEHTKTGAVLGSPRYMSPEQTRSAANVDHRSDLWSMGVILFEGLTGTWPHEGDSFSSLVVAICTVPPTSIDLMVPSLPEALRAIVRDCLKPLDQRITSASELASRLASVLTDTSLERIPLPRPLRAPSESVRTVTSVRVRPPTLTTTGASPSPESLRATHPREASPASTRAGASAYDDDATHIRPQVSRVSALPDPPSTPAPIAAAPPPSSPVFKPLLKTIPLSQSGALHAQLSRAGVFGQAPSAPAQPAAAPPQTPTQQTPAPLAPPTPLPASSPFAPASAAALPPPSAVFAAPTPPPGSAIFPAPSPPDPLLGTVSRNNFETRPSTFPDTPSLVAPAAQPLAAFPAPSPKPLGRGLGVLAAVLSVVLLGIVVALVAVLRSGPPGPPTQAKPGVSTKPTASASQPPASAAAPAPTTPPVEPAPSVTTSAAAPKPAAPAPHAPAPKGGSKVKQLGSGL